MLARVPAKDRLATALAHSMRPYIIMNPARKHTEIAIVVIVVAAAADV